MPYDSPVIVECPSFVPESIILLCIRKHNKQNVMGRDTAASSESKKVINIVLNNNVSPFSIPAETFMYRKLIYRLIERLRLMDFSCLLLYPM